MRSLTTSKRCREPSPLSRHVRANRTVCPQVQRVLAGFAVHPNVGAVLLVDQGSEVLGVKVGVLSRVGPHSAGFALSLRLRLLPFCSPSR